MESLGTTTIAVILVVIAIGIIAWAMHIFEKADKIKKDAEIDLDNLRREVARRKEHNIYLEELVRTKEKEIMALRSDVPIFRDPRHFSLERDPNGYVICADFEAKDFSGIILPIKSFPFGDDKDFALLEAQELLDHLNEK